MEVIFYKLIMVVITLVML